MDNLLDYEPLWLEEDVLASSISLMKTFLSYETDNMILEKIRELSEELDAEPIAVVHGAIYLWYQGSIPIVSREPNMGLSEHIAEDEGFTSPAAREHLNRQFRFANRGYLSMLMATEAWEKPTHPKLQAASLITNAAISFLFATYVIAPHMEDEPLWTGPISEDPVNMCQNEMLLFLKTNWHVQREGWQDSDHRPGAEFDALKSEVKMSEDGKRLLTQVGYPDWHEVPSWHPFRVVPGSPWNKFIRNRYQKIFPVFPAMTNRVRYMVPGSAASLTNSFREYYNVLRSQYDSTETRRTQPTEHKLELQFWRLAEGTGLKYPTVRPLEENGHDIEDYGQAGHMSNVPLVRKPASDMSGNLTLPFLSTTSRAFRFESEPEIDDDDSYAMIFQQ
ncbi:hypothetical protein AK830_g7440 [Neonectria ditissima]|uniref:MAT1-1-2 n=1 Tax=Neonectria ditissima TaxID=78410 RepID=A0A0P7BG77_9HYPO|nr:hypothetical protein AK830_g7440 [Neonectria ditissima]